MYLPAVSLGLMIFTTCKADTELRSRRRRHFSCSKSSKTPSRIIPSLPCHRELLHQPAPLTWPRFIPKYRATGSPAWILGSWFSLSLLCWESRRSSGHAMGCWQLTKQRNEPWQEGVFSAQISSHPSRRKGHTKGTKGTLKGTLKGYYRASSSVTSSFVMTTCSGTSCKQRRG